MSMSFVAAYAIHPGDSEPTLAAFRHHVPVDVFRTARSIMGGGGEPPVASPPIVNTASAALSLYGAHLDVSQISGHHHVGLGEGVAALAAIDAKPNVTVAHIRSKAGLVSLPTDPAGAPPGRVALPARAA